MAGGVNGLAQTIAKTVKQSNTQTGIKTGRITSNRMIEVSGSTYPYSVAVDMPVSPGDWVNVMLNDNKTKAVVVGR